MVIAGRVGADTREGRRSSMGTGGGDVCESPVLGALLSVPGPGGLRRVRYVTAAATVPPPAARIERSNSEAP